ncbi:hypothetical protein RIF29_29976 [Crotalaria pallida]|uniref:Uncharacterized protein n=1 Tax=Crotalaria pallida TaxID=3830 RepID=A0AAN9HWN7_CROPI
MSGVPKRSHEETIHPSSKQPHEDSGTYPKFIPSVSNEHRLPYDIGQDSRAAKTPQKKELHGEARRDSQIAKSDKDVCIEGLGDNNNKDIRYDRDGHNDSKSDTKTEKDGHVVVSSHLNWKESKEYRGKRYPDGPSVSLDPWNVSSGYTPSKARKESSAAKERD